MIHVKSSEKWSQERNVERNGEYCSFFVRTNCVNGSFHRLEFFTWIATILPALWLDSAVERGNRGQRARMAPRSALLSIPFWMFMLVWAGEHITGSAKECTNAPSEDVCHSLRAITVDTAASTTKMASLYFRSPLADPSWRDSLRGTGNLLTSAQYTFSEDDDDFSKFVRKSRGKNGSDFFNYFVRTSGQRKKSSHSQCSAVKDPKSSEELCTNVDGNTMVASSQTGIRGESKFTRPLLKEVSLHRVALDPESLQGIAQETNLKYLLMLDVDSLVWSFRVTAGLPTVGSPYGGWEHPQSELRGHFVGHYLSAAALMWASTHNSSLQEKMAILVNALSECQSKLGTGYLSAFPSEFFDRFEAIEPVWAPYYTIHKIMAGLLDQYSIAGSETALGMALWMAEYFLRRVETVIHTHTIERHWNSLNEEVGGMNDVMYRLFMLTGDPEHLKLAHLFDKPCFLGLLALQTDGLSGFHSNTHIPLIVGAQMRFEATGDKLYATIPEYFMEIINASHIYATGGTSVSEFWTDPNRNGDVLGTENQETCTTYNMLKVARNMFRWSKDVKYADYYERTLMNSILGIQRGEEPGVMIYMLPQAAGTSKAMSYHGWGTPYDAFWCCYGTGIESFSKLGDSIYYEDYDDNSLGLHVAQFVSSNLTWDAVGLLLSQKVVPFSSNNPFLHVIFHFYDLPQGSNGNEAEIWLRIPSWTSATTINCRLNGLSMRASQPGNYFSISRVWRAGDVLEVDFGVNLLLEKIQDDRKFYSSLHAVLFGPYLLAAITDGDHEIGAVNTSSLSSWIVPVPASYSSQLFSFSQDWSANTVFEDSEVQGLGKQVVVLSYGNGSAGMKAVPAEGTSEAADCTFRLASILVRASGDSLIGRSIYIELYSEPGKVLVHTGANGKLIVARLGTGEPLLDSLGNTYVETHHSDAAKFPAEGSEYFEVVPGLSGEEDTVSFEAATLNGCFVASDLTAGITLQCQSEGKPKDPNLRVKASFRVHKGLATYNPVSFFIKGVNRQFLLSPIYAYKDEKYATYFNLTSI